jgi:uncharacterized protein YbaP (TraB family)
MLFKIETKYGTIPPSSLFGTLHLNEFDEQIGKEISLLPKKVKRAFEKARCYAFEADVTKNLNAAQIIETWFQQMDQANPGWYDAYVEQVIKTDFAGADKEADTVENRSSLKKKLRETTPIFFLNSILTAGFDKNPLAAMAPVLDVLLMKQAKSSNRPIYYIETLEEQLATFFGCGQPLEDHLAVYQHGIRFLQEKGKIFNDEKFLKESYLNQNLEALAKVRHPFAQIQPQIPALTTYLENLIKIRDQKMANFREFARGNVFMAVGVLHLPDIIHNLRQQGYIVSQVELGERCYSINPWRLEIISKEMQNFLNFVELNLHPFSFFSSDESMKSNLNCLRKAGWTNAIFGEIGIDALRSLLIQPTRTLEQCLYNKANELRFKPEEILHLVPKIRKTAFECLTSLQACLEADLSPADLMALGIDKLKPWLETPDRHLKLVFKMVNWQDVLAQKNDLNKLIKACYAADYMRISYLDFSSFDKSLQMDCMENLNGSYVLFKNGMNLSVFITMNHTLRQAFLTHPKASKELLKMVKQYHYPLKDLIKDNERLMAYLKHPTESFIRPRLAQELVTMICQQNNNSTRVLI